MATTRPLTLCRDECRVLIDRTMNMEMTPEDMRVIPFRLLIKLAGLFMEIVYPEQTNPRMEGTIYVTEAEAWLLRTKTNSGEKMEGDNFFGMRLLRKLYAVLIAFDDEEKVGTFLDADEEGPKMGQRERDILKLWPQQENGDEKQPA